MIQPQRVQLSRRKGWRMPPNTVNVARPGSWGNPYRVGKPVDLRQAKCYGWQLRHPDYVCCDAQEAVSLFAATLVRDDASIWLARRELARNNLACWCLLPTPGEPDICHGAVLLEIANWRGWSGFPA